MGDDLIPGEVTQLLGCSPTHCQTRGLPVCGDDGRVLRTARSGAWHFTITPEEAGTADVEEVVLHLLNRLPSDCAIWQSLGDRFDIDLFCGLFMESNNRGFGLSPAACRELAERGIEIGFDIYCPHDWPRSRQSPHTDRQQSSEAPVARSINCSVHGPQPETFVCQHIARSLTTREIVGFFWPADADEERPDAWCSACNERVARTGGEWIGEAAEHLDAQLLCARRYDEARALNLEPIAGSES